jgi:uncharacterized protein (TIGR02118 family)
MSLAKTDTAERKMIKLVSCLHRIPTLSRDEFQQHWREHHSSLLLRVKHLREYVQYHTLGNNPMSRKKVGSEPPFDGFEVTYWDSVEDLRAIVASDPDYAATRDDRKYFIDQSKSFTALVDEKVIIELDHPSAYALVECHSHRPGQTRSDFHHSWLTVHGDFGRKIYKSGLMPGYIQNQIVDMDDALASELSLDQKTFDGVGMAYYESAAQLVACASLPIVTQEAFKAEDDFTDQKRLGSVFARRHVLLCATR